MSVLYIVIEWHGNSQEVDAATIHGVFLSRDRAAMRAALAVLSRGSEIKVVEYPVDASNTDLPVPVAADVSR